MNFSQARRKLLAHAGWGYRRRLVANRFVQVLPQVPVDDARLELTVGALTLRFAASTPPAVVAALVEALG